MKTWITSDLHLHHFNVIKYSNRPFSTAEEMNEVIVNNYNSLVAVDDLVFNLGDLVIGAQNKLEECVKFNKILKGVKYYLSGNHDKFSEKEFGEFYIKDRVFYYNYKNLVIAMSHYPQEDVNVKLKHYDLYLHGHTHQNIVSNKRNVYNVCLEVNDYKPVLLDDIIKKCLDL